MLCLICERISMIKENNNPYFVYEFETGYAVIGDHQHFYGYTLFLCKEHITELHYLSKEIKQKHLAEMALIYEAVFNAFEPEKMNCELLGMGHAHIHWHIFPRKTGDTPQLGPVWWLPKEEMLNESKKPNTAELEKIKEKLRFEIKKLICTN